MALPEIEELERLAESVEVDREKLEENEALLKDGWSKLVNGLGRLRKSREIWHTPPAVTPVIGLLA